MVQPATLRELSPEELQMEGDHGFGSTNNAVDQASPDTMRHHFHARGRPQTPFFIISQPQSSSMTPLGLISLGLTLILICGVYTTITEPTSLTLAFAYAIGFGGIVELLASMWEAARGKLFSAVALGIYGGFMLGIGIYGALVLSGQFTAAPATIPDSLQMLFSLFGIVTFLLFICTLALNIALQLLFLLLTLTFFCLAAGQKHALALKVGGWFGIVTGSLAILAGFIEVFNFVNGHEVIPLGAMNWLSFLQPKGSRIKYNHETCTPRTYMGDQKMEPMMMKSDQDMHHRGAVPRGAEHNV